MSKSAFLSFEQVEEIHRNTIAQFGGTLGVRDKGALESAIFHPQNAYFYGGGDLSDIAAAYAFHTVEAQAFLDGEKRGAVGAALTFLEGNGVSSERLLGESTDSVAIFSTAPHRRRRRHQAAKRRSPMRVGKCFGPYARLARSRNS